MFVLFRRIGPVQSVEPSFTDAETNVDCSRVCEYRTEPLSYLSYTLYRRRICRRRHRNSSSSSCSSIYATVFIRFIQPFRYNRPTSNGVATSACENHKTSSFFSIIALETVLCWLNIHLGFGVVTYCQS